MKPDDIPLDIWAAVQQMTVVEDDPQMIRLQRLMAMAIMVDRERAAPIVDRHPGLIANRQEMAMMIRFGGSVAADGTTAMGAA